MDQMFKYLKNLHGNCQIDGQWRKGIADHEIAEQSSHEWMKFPSESDPTTVWMQKEQTMNQKEGFAGQQGDQHPDVRLLSLLNHEKNFD